MDTLAKRHRAHIENEQRQDFGLTPILDWSLWRGDHRITSWSADSALSLIHATPSRLFLEKETPHGDDRHRASLAKHPQCLQKYRNV
jgi:hypothetical protein